MSLSKGQNYRARRKYVLSLLSLVSKLQCYQFANLDMNTHFSDFDDTYITKGPRH